MFKTIFYYIIIFSNLQITFSFLNFLSHHNLIKYKNDKNNIVVITPTYFRKTQIPDLLRVGLSIKEAQKETNIIWIIVEDHDIIQNNIGKIIGSLKIKNYIYTAIKTQYHSCHRGITQRNYGLNITRNIIYYINDKNNNYYKKQEKNIGDNIMIYFGDDDNTYLPSLFSNIAKNCSRKVCVFNVGLISGRNFEGPKISKTNKKIVIGWHTSWRNDRKYAIDMAGFTFKGSILIEKENLFFQDNTKCGKQEDDFIQKIAENIKKDVEALDTDKILVWHTKSFSS